MPFDPHSPYRLVDLLVESARLVRPGVTLDALLKTILTGCLEALTAWEVVLALEEADSVRVFRAFGGHGELDVEAVSPEIWSRVAGAARAGGVVAVEGELHHVLRVDRGTPARAAALTFGGGTGLLVVVGASPESDGDLRAVATHAGNLIGNLRACQVAEDEARTDGLTGAFNYRYLMRRVEAEIHLAGPRNGSFALLMVDVDNLKTYNDCYGHLGGSAALTELARLLEERARPIDVIAKYGGDEFGILLPGTTLEEALRYSQDILARVEGHCFEGDPRRRLTITVGVALFPEDGTAPRELLRRADDRLFRAKAEGRNRIGVASSRVIART